MHSLLALKRAKTFFIPYFHFVVWWGGRRFHRRDNHVCRQPSIQCRSEDKGQTVKRGLLVDSSRGGVIISTGGEDNPRCRLPMREGVRVDLHVWWGCSSERLSMMRMFHRMVRLTITKEYRFLSSLKYSICACIHLPVGTCTLLVCIICSLFGKHLLHFVNTKLELYLFIWRLRKRSVECSLHLYSTTGFDSVRIRTALSAL